MDREIYSFLCQNNSYIDEKSLECLLKNIFVGLSKIPILTKQEMAFSLNRVEISHDVSSLDEYCVIQDSNIGRLVWILPEYFVSVCSSSLLLGDEADDQTMDLNAHKSAIKHLIFQASEDLSNLSFDEELLDLYPCKIQKGCSVSDLGYIQVFVSVNLGSLDNEQIIINIPCEQGVTISGCSEDSSLENQLFSDYENLDILQERFRFYSDAGYLYKKDYIRSFFQNCVAMYKLHGREKLIELMEYAPSDLVGDLLPHVYSNDLSADSFLLQYSLEIYLHKVATHIDIIDQLLSGHDSYNTLPSISNNLFKERILEYLELDTVSRKNLRSVLPDYCSYYMDTRYKYKQAILQYEAICFHLIMIGMKHLLRSQNIQSLEYEFELIFASSD